MKNEAVKFSNKTANSAFRAVVAAYSKANESKLAVAIKMRAFIDCPRIFDDAADGVTADDIVNSAFVDIMTKNERYEFMTVARYGLNVDGSRVCGADGEPLSFSAVVTVAKALKLASEGVAASVGADRVAAYMREYELPGGVSVRALRAALPKEAKKNSTKNTENAEAAAAAVKRADARANERAAALSELDEIKRVFSEQFGSEDGRVPGICSINFNVIEQYIKGVPFSVDIK